MKRKRGQPGAVFLSAVGAIAIGLAGCLAPPGDPERADLPDPARDPTRPAPGVAAGAPVADTPPRELDAPLDVEKAVRLALRYHPEIAAARARVEAATGRKIQAGAFPNPVFSAVMEAAPLDGRTTKDAEYPVGITQPIPLGGRLRAGTDAAEAGRHRLLHELAEQGRQVERAVRGAFAAALFARDALAVEREMLRGTEAAAALARERVDAGDTPADEQALAELERGRARISLRRTELATRSARIELQTALGPVPLADVELRGTLEEVLALPALEGVLGRLRESPALRARAAAIEEGEARVLREEAERIPDLDVELLYRRLEAEDSNAIDVGLGIPLPIFDRRQGAILEARSDLLEARARYRATEASVASRVRSIHARLEQELEIARIFRDELTPRSTVVLEAAEERYRAGETPMEHLIPVRREHRELELEYLDLLRQIALDWAELRSIIP